ncbi:MAG: hypothetical protein JHD31_00670 [Rhodoluna sp.]|jgi:hypothetical protein|nr:hypothetical protein [Rhodoluna sp.]
MAKINNSHHLAGVGGGMPNGATVADFSTYPEAVGYVERILRGNFPATSVAIVGTGLSTVERVRAKINYGKVAISGAMNGSWLGLFIYLIFGSSGQTTTETASPIFSLGSALLIGAGVGMLWQVIRFSMNKAKRSFSSASTVVATSYAVLVPSELTGEANQAFVKGGELEA